MSTFVGSTSGVSQTNSIYINSLLWGTKWKIENDNRKLTYSFIDNKDWDFSFYNAELNAFNNAIQAWANVANFQLEYSGFNDSDAELTFHSVNSSILDALGKAKPPGTFEARFVEGDVLINYDYYKNNPNSELLVGGYDYLTFVHEIGHALGLAHPHDTGGGSSMFPGVGINDPGDTGDLNLNQFIYTVMSYVDTQSSYSPGYETNWGFAAGPMAFDIAAIQHIYGINPTYNTGNNVYYLPSVNGVGTYWSCIWDAGGTDTISGQGASNSVTINLNNATLANNDPNAGGFISQVAGIYGGFTIANSQGSICIIENAIGSSYDDNITGNSSNNNLSGGLGNDTISGNDGDDYINAGEGNDIAYGGNGNDTILGGAGVDRLNGDAGDDYIDGGAGDEVEPGGGFGLKGGLGNDTIYGGSGRDNIYGDEGDDTLYGDAPNQAAPSAGLEINEADVIFGGDGNDYINGGYGGDYLRGGNGDDTIYGGASTDLLFGDDGNDYIDGGAGDDQDTNRGEGLKGGLGDDIILGGDGTDAVHGQAGNDILLGGTGNDLLTGGGGVNTLLGGAGNDLYYLAYLDPNNPVVNDSGSIIQDESGIDTLNLNNLPFSISNLARVGTALVIDLNKDNKFIFAQDVTLLNFFGTGKTKGTGFIEYIAGLDSTSFLSLVGNSPKTGTTGNDRDQTAIKGTTGNDYLGGQTGKDQIYGYAGNDILVAKDGKDELYGGTGDDLYLVSAADGFATIIQDDGGYDALNLKDVIISLSEIQSGKVGLYRWDDNNLLIDLNKDGYDTRSNDLIINFFFDPTATGAKAGVGFIEQLGNVSGYDVLNLFNALPRGGRPDETINYIPSAGTGNDTYIGTDGNDFIQGGDGNDIIYGGDGNDIGAYFTAGLRGGVGNDLIYGGYGNDIIDGEDGVDIIYGDEGDDVIFGGAGDDIALDSNNNTYAALKGGGGYDLIYGGFGKDIIDGGDGDDRLYGDDQYQEILNQTKGGDDIISGGAGDDYIDLGYGNDLAWGGDGNDTLYGAAGVDRLLGDAGNDFIDGGAGNDKFDPNGDYAGLKGGAGNDTIYGSFGDDAIDGQDGDDKLYGDDKDFPGRNPTEGGNDDIFGGTGNDYIDTGFGNDKAWGGAGNDTIYGGAGLDILIGEAGNDKLYLGLNDNAIDIVKYASGHGTDTIYQFVRGVGGDQLQFTGIAKIDVVKSGTSTQLRIGDGLAGNTGFGTGQLLATISGTSGFISSDVNVNLFGANFLFT